MLEAVFPLVNTQISHHHEDETCRDSDDVSMFFLTAPHGRDVRVFDDTGYHALPPLTDLDRPTDRVACWHTSHLRIYLRMSPWQVVLAWALHTPRAHAHCCRHMVRVPCAPCALGAGVRASWAGRKTAAAVSRDVPWCGGLEPRSYERVAHLQSQRKL